MNNLYNKKYGFPDHLCSDEEKNTEEFGLKMARAIENEWFYRVNDGICPFYNKRDKYHELRLYARGEQSTKLYKDLLTGGDDTSYTNYDWRPLQIIPKFVNLVVNQMSERLFDVKAEATDKFSTDLKDTYRQNLENLMIAKPIMEEAKQALGVDMYPQNYDDLPNSQEEIDLYMRLKYKPAIEIATEEAIKYTLDLNDYEETQNRVIEDITTIGIGAVKHKTDVNKGIIVDYVDPANLVYSYPRHRNFKDVYYYGEVQRITINELKRISNGKFSDDELRDIADNSLSWLRYQGNMNEFPQYKNNDFNNMMVTIMNFTFKSTNTITYKKKYIKNGGFKMTKKDSTFDKNSDSEGYDVVKKTIDVWYEGTLILGTDKIFNYKLCENMVRPEGLLNITIPNYILYAPEMYQNRTKSLVERIIPYVDQMQQIHIKLQQLIAKARPNGIYIDVDGLNEIDMGDGNFLTPLEVIKIYNETGNIIGTSVTAEGDYNYGREPIHELKNGIVDGLDRLINAYNHYLNLLRDAIGIPQGADASMPHPDTLVGVQKQVALNSNTATRHILTSSLNISQRLGLGLALRLKDIFKYSDLKALEKYHLHDLGINIELRPDIEEKQYLEQNIQQALAKELITLDDAIDIRTITNIKLANELLKTRRIKREKQKQEHEKELAKIQGDNQAQAVQAAAQAKQAEIQAKSQADLALVEEKAKAKIAEINAEKQAKSELMEQEFHYNMTIKGVETEADIYKNKYTEDRKDKRQDRQNTHTSKIQEQKANNSPAMNFENEPDNQTPIPNINHGNPNSLQPDYSFESSNDGINGNMGMGELEPH